MNASVSAASYKDFFGRPCGSLRPTRMFHFVGLSFHFSFSITLRSTLRLSESNQGSVFWLSLLWPKVHCVCLQTRKLHLENLWETHSADYNIARLLAEHMFIHLIIIIKFLSHSNFWLYVLYHFWLSVPNWEGGWLVHGRVKRYNLFFLIIMLCT